MAPLTEEIEYSKLMSLTVDVEKDGDKAASDQWIKNTIKHHWIHGDQKLKCFDKHPCQDNIIESPIIMKYYTTILIAKKKYYQKRRKGITFLMGTHERVGKNSSIYKFTHSKLYDYNLTKLIFEFGALLPFQPRCV